MYNYGPLCYDSIEPNTNIVLSGHQEPSGDYDGPVHVFLNATDTGSGVASTYYYVDQGGIFQPYSGPFYVYTLGAHEITAYSVDVAGNVEVYRYLAFVIDQNQHSVLSILKAGTGSGTVSSADGGIDCGSTCSSSYWDGQPITLTASPSPGSVFTGWRNCDLSFGFSCTLTILADRTATAIFNVPVPLQFVALTPCRLVDTRPQNGGNGPIQGDTSQTFNLPQLAQAEGCGDLSSAAIYSLNAAVVPSRTLGYLTLWPSGLTRPFTSALNSPDGRVKANAAIVPAGTARAVDVYATHTTDVVLDIDGYFAPVSSSTLAFYPLTPCRVVDTRKDSFLPHLGPPALMANTPRDLPVRENSCIPADVNPQAYSFNFTVVPINQHPIGYLSVWPTGQSQPVVSTLNDQTGTIVANAAIVPAGTGGDITVFATDDTQLLIDINGYFAMPTAQMPGLSLYALAPCRTLDTRHPPGGGGQPFTGLLAPVDIVDSQCGPPSTAQAYVFNTTVVPVGSLGLSDIVAERPAPSARGLNPERCGRSDYQQHGDCAHQ